VSGGKQHWNIGNDLVGANANARLKKAGRKLTMTKKQWSNGFGGTRLGGVREPRKKNGGIDVEGWTGFVKKPSTRKSGPWWGKSMGETGDESVDVKGIDGGDESVQEGS